jgi:hypothetical protein
MNSRPGSGGAPGPLWRWPAMRSSKYVAALWDGMTLPAYAAAGS